MEKELSVVGIIESVCDDICNNYCKYTEQSFTDQDELNEICENFPLNKLQ